MSFPGAIPSYQGFTSSDTLKVDNHGAQHNQEQADIAALATKMGTGSSTPVNNTVLRGTGAGTSAWAQVNLATDVTGQLSSTNASLVIQAVYPVGCIYTETTGVNPGTTFGFGTWTAFGAGRVLVGNGTSDQAFAAGATGGESNHTLTSNEMPSHTHTITDPGHTHTYSFNKTIGGITAGASTGANTPDVSTGSSTTGITNQNTGGGATHNNLQPYIVVYMWQRVS